MKNILYYAAVSIVLSNYATTLCDSNVDTNIEPTKNWTVNKESLKNAHDEISKALLILNALPKFDFSKNNNINTQLNNSQKINSDLSAALNLTTNENTSSPATSGATLLEPAKETLLLTDNEKMQIENFKRKYAHSNHKISLADKNKLTEIFRSCKTILVDRTSKNGQEKLNFYNYSHREQFMGYPNRSNVWNRFFRLFAYNLEYCEIDPKTLEAVKNAYRTGIAKGHYDSDEFQLIQPIKNAFIEKLERKESDYYRNSLLSNIIGTTFHNDEYNKKAKDYIYCLFDTNCKTQGGKIFYENMIHANKELVCIYATQGENREILVPCDNVKDSPYTLVSSDENEKYMQMYKQHRIKERMEKYESAKNKLIEYLNNVRNKQCNIGNVWKETNSNKIICTRIASTVNKIFNSCAVYDAIRMLPDIDAITDLSFKSMTRLALFAMQYVPTATIGEKYKNQNVLNMIAANMMKNGHFRSLASSILFSPFDYITLAKLCADIFICVGDVNIQAWSNGNFVLKIIE